MLYTIDNRQYPIDTGSSDRAKRIMQNCKNLLMTRMGQIPYGRVRGFDPALLDLPIAKLKAVLMQELDRVLLFEPNAELVDAECSLDKDGSIYITMTVDINEEVD